MMRGTYNFKKILRLCTGLNFLRREKIGRYLKKPIKFGFRKKMRGISYLDEQLLIYEGKLRFVEMKVYVMSFVFTFLVRINILFPVPMPDNTLTSP